MKAGNPNDRAKDILPFVRTITKHLAVGVVKALGVDAYKAADGLLSIAEEVKASVSRNRGEGH